MNDLIAAAESEQGKQDKKNGQELGDLVIDYLKKIGVEYVFGVPGGAIEPLYDALARSEAKGGPRSVVARHEAGAAFMADGYARETGRIGVCCSTTGPGATNLITGVASAQADNVPLLVITAQTALPNFGKRALQESSCTAIDTVSMFNHCAGYSSLVSHRGQLESKLIASIMHCLQVPHTPAHISIPTDVLRAPRRLRDGKALMLDDRFTEHHPMPDEEILKQLTKELARARKVVLFLGDGSGEAIDMIMKFAEHVQTPIVTGPSGKRWIDAYHPLYRGVFGFGGHESARNALLDEKVDIILAVGTRLGELSTGSWDHNVLLNNKLIHIDASRDNFTHSPMARMHVYGRISSVFKTLNEHIEMSFDWGRELVAKSIINDADDTELNKNIKALPRYLKFDDPEKCIDDSTPLKPQRVVYELTKRLPSDTRYVIDAGNSWSWATHYLHPRSQGNYRIAMGYGSMAWGIGAAVGTSLGCLDELVVCISGDGSYLMSGQEITVALQENLPVIFVVLNDSALGMVKHGQRMGGGMPIGFELPVIDFAAMAKAMGVNSYTIKTAEDFEILDLEQVRSPIGPVLLDVYIDPEEIPSMGVRMKTLTN